MESIDRLREYLDKNVRKLPHTEWIANEPMELRPSRIYGYIDAIEREVEDNERFRREAEPFHNRLREAVKFDEDVTIFGVDYTALPLDAEGVPIHIGDVMEWPDTSTAEVVGIGDGTFFYVEDGEDAAEWSCAGGKIHHHAPTVEDVLREMCLEIDRRCERGSINYDKLFAEYAAKLALRGDE